MPPPLKSEQNKSANIVRAVTMLKWPDLTQVKPTMEVGGSNPSWGGFNSEQGAATPKVGSLNLEEFNQK